MAAIYSPQLHPSWGDSGSFNPEVLSPQLSGVRFQPYAPIMRPSPLSPPPYIYFERDYFDKFDLATYFFPSEEVLEVPNLSEPLDAFIDKMKYKPHEITISNVTSLPQEISVEISGYSIDSFACSRIFKIEIPPSEFIRLDLIPDILNAQFGVNLSDFFVKKINLNNTSSSINLYEHSLTRSRCDLVIENFKRPLMPLPFSFKSGLEVTGLDLEFEKILYSDQTPTCIKDFGHKARNIYNHYVQNRYRLKPPSLSTIRLPVMTPQGLIDYFPTPIQTLSPAIPKRVNFIWMGSSLPDKYFETLLSWRKHNPTYPIIVWTDITEKEVIENDKVKYFLKWCKLHNIKVLNFKSIFPKTATEKEAPLLLKRELQDAYDRRNYGMVSDILRYEILYRFGGIYADTDNPCFHPWDEVIKDVDSIIGLCPPSQFTPPVEFSLAPDTMAATPFHPIMQESINLIKHRFWECLKKDVSHTTDTLYRTSCFLIEQAYTKKASFRDVCFPPSVLHPSGRQSWKLQYKDQPSPPALSGAYIDTTWVTNPFESYLHETDLEKCQRMARIAEVDMRRFLSSVDSEFHIDLENMKSETEEINQADLTIDYIIDNCPDLLDKITKINLTNSDISEDGFLKIAENFKNLEKLVLNNTNISIPVLKEILKNNPHIKILSLANCRKLTTSPRLWSTILPYFKNLDELNLKRLELPAQLIKSLQSSISFPNLKNLNIRYTSTGKNMEDIVRIILANPSLEIIKVDRDAEFSIQCYENLLITQFLQDENKNEFLSSVLTNILGIKNQSASSLSDEEFINEFIETLTCYAQREKSLFTHLLDTKENLSKLPGFEFLKNPVITEYFSMFLLNKLCSLKESILIEPDYQFLP